MDTNTKDTVGGDTVETGTLATFKDTFGNSSMLQDSPIRYNRKKPVVANSVFGGNTIEGLVGLERINERSSTWRNGKDYLRARTLNKGCQHLIKMVERLHER